MPAQPPPIETVGLIGLGYVGLPLALALARGGLRQVVGFDISAPRVAELVRGHDRTREAAADQLKAAFAGPFTATTDDAHLHALDAYIVTDPTPVDEANPPDLAPLQGARRTLGAVLARRPAGPPPIIAFESTVYPGLTENICGPAIRA